MGGMQNLPQFRLDWDYSKDYLELNLVHLAGEGAIHWANGWWRWISRLHALVKK